jgi:hypothetical protein
VYADLTFAGPHAPSAIAELFGRAARESLNSGQFDLALKSLEPEDVLRCLQELPAGHDRLALDSNLILLDAGAMVAYAPYRSTILLSSDPFESIDRIGESLGVAADTVRIRLHDALLTARKVIALSSDAFNAMASLLRNPVEHRSVPPAALRPSGDAVLVVKNSDDDLGNAALDMIAETFPDREFVRFDPATVFEQSWKLVLQLGFPQSSLPGARLNDAWVGGVPVVQLVNPANLRARRRRQGGQIGDIVVDHGKTGLLCLAVDELSTLLADLFADMLPARAVARGARHRTDPPAEWDVLLKAILQ